jgi:site-specific DNA recombinase
MGLKTEKGKDRIAEIELQFTPVKNALNKYFQAFEKETLKAEDCAFRIRDLNTQLSQLETLKKEVQAQIDSDIPFHLDASQVTNYAGNFCELLSEGTITEQKSFLRSFIKRIDYEPDKVAISYTIPVAAGDNRMEMSEVLSMEPVGSRLQSPLEPHRPG